MYIDIESAIEVINIQQSYLYLMYQLILGIRPIGDKTKLYSTNEDLMSVWVLIQKEFVDLLFSCSTFLKSTFNVPLLT